MLSLRVAVGVAAGLALPCPPALAVVGGFDAPPSGYDAVARVAVAGVGVCGGTLIAPRWVLSAGHCAEAAGVSNDASASRSRAPVNVTLGTTRVDGGGGQRIRVDKLALSPAYHANRSSDVALLHLAAPARQAPLMIAGVGRAGLWQPGAFGTIAGFGRTQEDGDKPGRMQIADVPIVADRTCRAAYPRSFESATQLCAGYRRGGVDACQGDSGGPLLASDEAGVLRLVGVTSYGEGCARAGRFGMYARVADTSLREWIRAWVPEAIDDDASAPATALPLPSTPPTTDPPRAAQRSLEIVRLRMLKGGGARLELVVPYDGELHVRWKAGSSRGSRAKAMYAGRRSLILKIPRRVRRVSVVVTLTPSR